MKIRNVSGHDLVVPGLGRQVLAGQIVDVPDGDVGAYTCQPSVWAGVPDPGADDLVDPPADPADDPSADPQEG